MKALRVRLSPSTLRYQLLLRSLLILVVILIAIGSFQFMFMERFLYQNKADAIRRQIQTIPGEVWDRFSQGLPKVRQNRVFIFPASSVAYRDRTNNWSVFAQNPDAGSVPRLDDQFYTRAINSPRNNDHPRFRVAKDDRGIEQLIVAQPVRAFGQTRGIVQVSVSTGPLREEVLRHLALYAVISLCAIGLGCFFFLPVIRRTLAPLSKVTKIVEGIDSGRLSDRLPEAQGQIEVDLLAATFNRMLGRIEKSFIAEQEAKERMRRFVADASHELRTPLTSIHGFLEILLRGAAAQPEQLEKSLRSMYGESERMNKLVRDLLLLAKLDRAPELDVTEIDLSAIVRGMEPQLRLLAEQREVSFDLHAVPEVPLDADKIKQVILNLFDNAIQHTDPLEGRIQIIVETAAGNVQLAVGDNGSGIPAKQQPRLFDRFYRTDESRSRLEGGAGLGLSISRAIVESHGGSIAVDSTVGQGSEFRIVLPGAQLDRK